jgi:hypothetical protein
VVFETEKAVSPLFQEKEKIICPKKEIPLLLFYSILVTIES